MGNHEKLWKSINQIRQNIKTYLEQFRIITDEVSITDGYAINFGVVFDVVAHKTAVKQQVKLACIEKIKDYVSNFFKSNMDEDYHGLIDTNIDTPEKLLEFLRTFNTQAINKKFSTDIKLKSSMIIKKLPIN